MSQPRNKFEYRIQKELAQAVNRGKLQAFEYETKRIPYILAGFYIPDFTLQTQLGEVLVETKGYLRPADKRKLVAVKKQHPEIDLRIVFYDDNPKNIKWAIKHGFRYAIHEIPKEWLRGL